MITTNKLHSVIAIRTIEWTNSEEAIYKRLSEYFPPENIFVVMNEFSGKINVPEHINKISLNLSFLKQQQLLDCIDQLKLGWLCGDYFYYAFATQVDAEYYWLIEPDVGFTFENISSFFQFFENDPVDAVLDRYFEAEPHWMWTANAKLLHHTPYQCFFPITRLSKKAIQYCLKERQKLTQYFIENNIAVNQYPNDESLVATTVHKHQLSVKCLTDFDENITAHYTCAQSVTPLIMDSFPRNQLVHPLKSPQWISEKIAHIIIQGIDQSINQSINQSRIVYTNFGCTQMN